MLAYPQSLGRCWGRARLAHCLTLNYCTPSALRQVTLHAICSIAPYLASTLCTCTSRTFCDYFPFRICCVPCTVYHESMIPTRAFCGCHASLVTACLSLNTLHPSFSWSTYTSARFGYRRSACSSRNSIHALRNLLPLQIDVSVLMRLWIRRDQSNACVTC